MHLLYVDHSGDPADPNLKYVVLAGVSLFERQGHWISSALDNIAANFDPANPERVELHGSPMRQGRNGWRRFPVAARIQAIADSLDVLAKSHRSNGFYPDSVDG